MRAFKNSFNGCVLLATTVLPLLSAAQHSPSINVALKTSFNAGPYLLELLETAALENSTSYFPLLDRIAEGSFAELHTDQDLYERFVEVLQQDGHLSSPESVSSFKFALALRSAAPRVEAHYQYYKTYVETQIMAAQDAVCPVWVHLDGQQYCSPALERAQQPVDMDDWDTELPFDRTLGASADSVVSVLYADITHPLFSQFHETVSRTAREGKTQYRLRYRPSSGDRSRPLHVSGYGAELVLKRTDYIVIDDRDAEKPERAEGQSSHRNDEKTPDFKPLTTSELSKLGLNAGSYIMSSDDPFTTLIDVSANFPKHSSAIASTNVTSGFLEEHLANREKLLPPGFNVILMNGLQIERRDINAYSLLDSLRRERSLINQLKETGLSAAQAVDLLSHEVLAQALADEEVQRYDWRDDEEGGSVIMWMNNIEKDKRYASWTDAPRMLLQRTYPGQLPQVRLNIHNLVLPLDLGDIKELDIVVNTLQAIVKRGIPIRVGLVPAGESSIALTGAKVSYHLFDTYGVSRLMSFYEELVESKKGLSGIESIFERITQDQEPREGKIPLTFADVLKATETEHAMAALDTYQKRLALKGSRPPVFTNGVAIVRDDAWFDKMSQRLTMDLRALQMGIYEQTINPEANLTEHFLSASVSRRNTLIIPSNLKDIKVLNVADITAEFSDSLAALPRINGLGQSALLSDRAHLVVIADFATKQGNQLVLAAIDFHTAHQDVEIVFVHNGLDDGDIANVAVRLGLGAAPGGLTEEQTKHFLDMGDTEATSSEDEVAKATAFWRSQRPFISKLGFADGEHGVWLNGRIVGPIKDEFTTEDFEALLKFESLHRIVPVTTAITGLALEDRFSSQLDLAKVTSIVARSLVSDVPQGIYETSPPIRVDKYRLWTGDHTLIHLKSKSDPTIQIVASIDPASEAAQPWIPLLKTLSELAGVDVKIYLNPRNQLEELPIKRFYSQVVSSAPRFDASGALEVPAANFKNVPKETLFNLGMDVPPSWLVAPEESVYDLDNIKLSGVPAGQNVDAVYELEHILVEGHSRDSTSGSPPRGVQLLLGTEQNPHFADTIIMANLGYFQFKANPGYWQIALEKGRSSKIFTIDSIGAKGYTPQPGDETTSVALMSFQGVTLYPRLSRKAGMEAEDVLEASSGSAMDYLGKGASFASSAFSSLGIGKSKTAPNADINIFSVASGHLYERMLNIMMVSVMRHTKHSVKFWFIEQFLSPSFKSSLPYLAEHYKFKYEMVTYKWPHWLRGQKEKQREIWGYKILFLDVLFPLNLDKVIFVDADQIVRTDMMELNKVDLQGAPYGFTPMCDSRTEMEGFRFWKQGYWKNFLNGKPYHISALYVVDLKKFRELAAGDRLRGQYHSLSADPGSLSNLDQDLPNHMQHNLPIHSLDQNWLWCETWCSDEALKEARTIDLCNNPQTKEPKLDRARRQVPEWTEYDDEIADVLRKAKGVVVQKESVQEAEQKILQVDDRHEHDGEAAVKKAEHTNIKDEL